MSMCVVKFVYLPKNFPIGGRATCPRCKESVIVTENTSKKYGRYTVEHEVKT